MPAWAPTVNSVGMRGSAAADFFPDAQIDSHVDTHHDFIFGGSTVAEQHGVDNHHMAAADTHHHIATAHIGPLGEAPGVVGPGAPFDIPPDSVLDAMKAVLEGQEEEMRQVHRDKLVGLKVPVEPAHPHTAAASVPATDVRMATSGFQFDPTLPAEDIRMATSGLHLDIIGPLKILKTAVLVTGGMCSKLFGIGMMGFLVFQSFKSNQQQQQQQDQRNSQQSYQNQARLQCGPGNCAPGCCRS